MKESAREREDETRQGRSRVEYRAPGASEQGRLLFLTALG